MLLIRQCFYLIFVCSLLQFGLCEQDDGDEPYVDIIGSNDWDFSESKRIHILFSGYYIFKYYFTNNIYTRWRHLPHSYAFVCQNILLELMRFVQHGTMTAVLLFY